MAIASVENADSIAGGAECGFLQVAAKSVFQSSTYNGDGNLNDAGPPGWGVNYSVSGGRSSETMALSVTPPTASQSLP